MTNIFFKKPFFIRYQSSVILVTLTLCTLSYFFLDISAAQYFRNNPPLLNWIATAATHFINPEAHILLWPVLFFIARRIKAPNTLVTFLLLLTITMPCVKLATAILKPLLGRARPELLFAEGVFGFTFFKWKNAYLSCPSGHSSVAGALCGTLSCYYPKKTALFILAALICAFSRVVLEEHYPGDILAGLALGAIISSRIWSQMSYIK